MVRKAIEGGEVTLPPHRSLPSIRMHQAITPLASVCLWSKTSPDVAARRTEEGGGGGGGQEADGSVSLRSWWQWGRT